MTADVSPAARFTALAQALAAEPGVVVPDSSRGRRFGSDALTVDGSIFAMLTGDRLVVKLPRTRVAELIGSGEGHEFPPGRSRPYGEWVGVDVDQGAAWEALAREALAFVRRT